MMPRCSWLLPAISVGLLLGFMEAPAAAAEDPDGLFAVETVSNLAYYEGKDADPVKHRLDLYLPKGKKDFPVLFFIHGGAWMMGDKNHFGIYSALGRNFAKLGIGTVVPSYRLSPKVKHPEHVRDVARAFAWTYRNIEKHGGRPDRVFVCGHSAGGHLAALLATDDTYLRGEGLSLKAIRGVVPMSGVYQIPPGLLPEVFGTDRQIRQQASPISHVRQGLPPFLFIYGESDILSCDQASKFFCSSLESKGCHARTLEVKNRNHFTLILRVSWRHDPVALAVRDFLIQNSNDIQ